MKDKGLEVALAAGMLGMFPPMGTGRGRKHCFECEQPILPGEGYRHVTGKGYIHGACAQRLEKDNGQGQSQKS